MTIYIQIGVRLNTFPVNKYGLALLVNVRQYVTVTCRNTLT